MDYKDACELAFKNGYEKGRKEKIPVVYYNYGEISIEQLYKTFECIKKEYPNALFLPSFCSFNEVSIKELKQLKEQINITIDEIVKRVEKNAND